jgi:hypothetical protein
MNFQGWYESVLSRVEKEHPVLQDPRINEVAIMRVVRKMADNSLNVIALTKFITKSQQPYNSLRDNGPIARNLIKIDDERLGEYTASVEIVQDDPAHYLCKFIVDGPKAGSLVVSHPPLLYDNQDKELLFGQFVHEMDHAIHWVKGANFNVHNPRVDIDAYLHTIHEAKAFIVQLKLLLKRFGNSQEVMAAISRKARIVSVPGVAKGYLQPAPFRWENETLLQFAQELLKTIELNEAIIPTIGKALVAASAMMPNLMPQMAKMPEIQPHVAKAQDPNTIADYALDEIQRLGKKLFLKNFVK